ncbi:PREDICTED: uncharacterized protein LOC104808842 [Tarenaya hassleriana]|uniref:uncharacterized protein LOC104808842 n=1 Tax=Tarenaya hassleriana TaxID=28532 RepID=UPI00053C8DC1|nr:PREDICTED: uncharacterized protein LOC104808842 [Tarenaya hassleriana]
MSGTANLISCNSSSVPPLKPSKRTQTLIRSQNLGVQTKPSSEFRGTVSKLSAFRTPDKISPRDRHFPLYNRKGSSQVCKSSLNDPDSEESGTVSEERDWTSSVLLLVLWGALLYYAFNLSPNQTPTQDLYFLKKLLNLKGDDGFRMNQILTSLWYIMGLWPLVYAMLLLPTGSSSKNKIPAWPFVVASVFGGVYVLLPYFALWSPPPPRVSEAELRRWPLNLLESKLTSGIAFLSGLALILYAVVLNGTDWTEFYQYFRESKFIHVMSLDFCLLSAFAPFWVYNDMTARKWYEKGWWLLPVSVVPFLGPSLYLFLRPSLSEIPVSTNPESSEPRQ